MKNEFLYSYSSTINNEILDSLNPKEKIVSVSLNIKASHAGKVNGNFVFYTPRSMQNGSNTLLHPFKSISKDYTEEMLLVLSMEQNTKTIQKRIQIIYKN